MKLNNVDFQLIDEAKQVLTENLDLYEDKNTIANTKIYCEILSSTRLKNHLPMRGIRTNINTANRMFEMANSAQNLQLILPCFTISSDMTNTSNDKMVVIMVPPMVMVTDRLLLTPNRLTMG